MAARATTFFKKNGRYLRGIIKPKESVTSIFPDLSFETLTTINSSPKTRGELILDKLLYLRGIMEKLIHKAKSYQIITKDNRGALLIAKISTSYDLAKTWITASFILFVGFSLVLVLFPTKLHPDIDDRYSIYSSRPLVLDSNTMRIYSRDARAQRINEVMREYNCPMEGLGEIFVSEADKNDIPWWLVASIAFQESSCGKNMPSLEGQNSFNSWGWGVYGENVHVFDNWVRGIETVSSYMNEMFFSQGMTEPCEIMKTYTPPSQGSWCEGVNYFGDLFKNYKTPIE